MSGSKDVYQKVLENRKQSRQVQLRETYTTDELIEALKKRDLTQEQALELESMLLSIPDKD